VLVSIARSGEWLEIAVEDDGTGFDVRSTMEGQGTGKALGLLGMQERVGMLDGEFEIGPGGDGGTRVFARLPIKSGSA
jgi:signal transduction histidine kinase